MAQVKKERAEAEAAERGEVGDGSEHTGMQNVRDVEEKQQSSEPQSEPGDGRVNGDVVESPEPRDPKTAAAT